MSHETLPPGTERFYDIYGWTGWIEPDGVILIRARATDGTDIWVGRAPTRDRYEVFVEGPREPKGRRYEGGPGSPAHERYEAFRAAYERNFGPLDAPPESMDTDQRQDE